MPDTWDFQERMHKKFPSLSREQIIEFINDVVMKRQEGDLAVKISSQTLIEEAIVAHEMGNVVLLRMREEKPQRGMR